MTRPRRLRERFSRAELYFDDIVDAAESGTDLDLLDNKEVIEGLESTNESVISHRQNDILRVLTVFGAPAADADHGHLRMNVHFSGFASSEA
jgi:Mg2+ and Co2+ transporter CorA